MWTALARPFHPAYAAGGGSKSRSHALDLRQGRLSIQGMNLANFAAVGP